ncbi:MAG: antibiotic biosynthesis monooxygenase family protein [Dermatophilaceae bacterium]
MRHLGLADTHAFRQYDTDPSRAERLAARAAEAARHQSASDGCLSWTVHLAHDRTRVVTVEAWRDLASFRDGALTGPQSVVDGVRPDVALYRHAGTGGVDPTPVGDPASGVTVIDVFRVWRPLIRPVSAFNLRNGEAFNRDPGCVSTSVLRGITAGRIATYARWRSTEDFLRVFSATQGHPVQSTDEVNATAARISRGLVRTDYHAYDVVSTHEGAHR